MSTIYALSTPPGKSGVAVIRISGEAVKTVISRLFKNIIPARRAVLRKILHPVSRETIDTALILFFENPASFTGEDVLELHIHGGPANVQYMLEVLGKMPELRPAEAGEFSRRAFDNERIDLTELEGLADLIDAETQVQRKAALVQAQGHHKILYQGWRKQIIESLSLMTAAIDFSDEEDIAEDIEKQAAHTLNEIRTSIQSHLNSAHQGEIIRSGFRIVLAGAPNAGKSSLMNWLARRDIAIVSSIPGTTRDGLETSLDIDGFKVILSDTAGIRETFDEIEQEGIRRSRAYVKQANLVLWLVDAQELEKNQAKQMMNWDELNGLDAILVLTKSDLVEQLSSDNIQEKLPDHVNRRCRDILEISIKSGNGLELLIEKISKIVKQYSPELNQPVVSRDRYKRELVQALKHIGNSQEFLTSHIELAAEEMRLAANHLGRLTGDVDVEDLLDHIFSSFCIGK